MNNAMTMARPAAIVPTNFGDVMAMAQAVAKTQFVPKAFFDKPHDVAAAIMMGMGVGLNPMQALQTIAVINGKPAVYGDGMIAIVRASGQLEHIREWLDVDESGEMVANCEVKRAGYEKHVSSFSASDAKKAQLWGKSGPWQQYPQRMLKMRARSWALRDQFADVLGGLYSAEDEADIPARAEPLDITPAATVTAANIAEPAAYVGIAHTLTRSEVADELRTLAGLARIDRKKAQARFADVKLENKALAARLASWKNNGLRRFIDRNAAKKAEVA